MDKILKARMAQALRAFCAGNNLRRSGYIHVAGEPLRWKLFLEVTGPGGSGKSEVPCHPAGRKGQYPVGNHRHARVIPRAPAHPFLVGVNMAARGGLAARLVRLPFPVTRRRNAL